MNRAEFKKKMVRVKNKHYKQSSYLCFDLRDVFDKNSSIMKGYNEAKSCEILRRVFKGKKDTSAHGLFGDNSIEKNRETRKIALEIFETIVIDEKWYKEL